jgi:Bacterial Ig domain
VMGWSGGTFEFVDGLIGGFLMVRSGAVAVEGTADAGSVLILTGGGASLSGHIPEGVQIWVRGSDYGGHTSVAVQDGTLNDGRIRMEAADQGYSCNLVLSGVLTNGPTGVMDSQVGTGGDRVISGTLVNQGLVDATAYYITYYGTYEVAGGRMLGGVNLIHVTVRQTASPTEPNTLRLMGDSTLLTDNLPNVELWVNGNGWIGNATLQITHAAVNRGAIRVESSDGGYLGQVISGGTLSNAPMGSIRFGAGAGGPRSFTGQLLNSGVLTVDSGMQVTMVGPTFDNLAGGLVTGQGSYDVTFTLFRNAGVLSPAGGNLTFIGNMHMETGGVLELAVSGPTASLEYEQVFVNGLANLRGNLRIQLAPSYHPPAGTEFLLISATHRFGNFLTVEHPGTSTAMSALYDSTSVRLLVDNGAPIAVEDTIERKRGAGIKIRPARLLLNDQDPEGQALTVVSVGASSASGGSVIMEEGWIIYSPRPGAPLFDSFIYVVRDPAGAETTGQVTIVEAGPDGQPSRNISGISVPEGGPAMVRGHGIPGRTYRIDAKSQLSDPDWQPLGSVQVSPDGTWNLPDESASAHETRFYRTVEL